MPRWSSYGLTPNDRLVLQAICNYFRTLGKWPTYEYLDITLSDDHPDLDVESVGHRLEPFMYDGPYSPMIGWEPNRETSLSISALHTCLVEGICPDVGEDLDGFVTTLQFCVEKYRNRERENLHSVEITSDELRERLGWPDLMIRKVFDMVARTGLTAGSSYRDASPTEPGWWTFTVSPEIRKYRRVATIEDFLRERERAREEQRRRYQSFAQPQSAATETDTSDPADTVGHSVAPDMSKAPTLVQLRPIGLFPSGPFTRDEHLCFVLMPFAEDLRAVYDEAIVLAATQAKLTCLRADEIFKPGTIMGQVWQKLVEARVVVADLTGRNPNVFYELGLAHTIGHDVILLTQDMQSVPFDLRHMRCIVYEATPHGLPLLQQTLRRAMSEVLAAV